MTEAPAADLSQPKRRRDLWPWLSLLPFGFGSWAPVVAGVRCGVLRWTLLGLFWPALAIAGGVAGTAGHTTSSSGRGNFVLLLYVAWIGGAITSFLIRQEYDRRSREARVAPAPWPQPTERSRRWSARYALAAYVLTFVAASAIGAGLSFGFGIHLRVGAGVILLDVVFLSSLVPIARRRGLSRQDIGLRATRAGRSMALVALAFIAYVGFAYLWYLAVLHKHSSASPLHGVKHESTINVGLAILAAGVSAPVVEEIFFRGLLYRSLRNRLATRWAAPIAGALFGLAHFAVYPVHTLPIMVAFGVMACLLYERTGSLLPGIAIHSFVDSTGIDVELTGNDAIVGIVFGVLVAVLLVRATTGRYRAATIGSVSAVNEVAPA